MLVMRGMKDILLITLYMFMTIVRAMQPGGVRKLVAENIVLRQQLITMRRRQKRSPRLGLMDRFIFGYLASMINPNRLTKVSITIKPATILKFHKALIKRKYRLLYSSKPTLKPGPKGPSKEVIDLIIEMKRRNPRFGYRRIAMQISYVLNIDIDKDVVRRVLQKHCFKNHGNEGPSWLSLFGQMKDSLWSIDLFRCESIMLKSHWVMVVMDQFTRRVIGFAVHAGVVDGVVLCCMFNKIISNKSLPKYLSSDHDPLFKFYRWQANLRILGIKEIKTLPYIPMSHPYIERLIGTIRHEYLDQTLFWNEADLEAKLIRFMQYYNDERCHWSLRGITPNESADESKLKCLNSNNVRWMKTCNGLYELPIAV